MTAVSKNFYFNVLDDIVNKYNNTVHTAIKIKTIDATSDSYAKYNEDFNERDPKFKVGDHARISKYKNIFAKGYTQNWSEGLMLLVTQMVKKLLEVFMKRNGKDLVKKNSE